MVKKKFFLVRKIRYNKQGKRIGAYKKVEATSLKAAIKKAYPGIVDLKPMKKGEAKRNWLKRNKRK